jgi:hypothetical protein
LAVDSDDSDDGDDEGASLSSSSSSSDSGATTSVASAKKKRKKRSCADRKKRAEEKVAACESRQDPAKILACVDSHLGKLCKKCGGVCEEIKATISAKYTKAVTSTETASKECESGRKGAEQKAKQCAKIENNAKFQACFETNIGPYCKSCSSTCDELKVSLRGAEKEDRSPASEAKKTAEIEKETKSSANEKLAKECGSFIEGVNSTFSDCLGKASNKGQGQKCQDAAESKLAAGSKSCSSQYDSFRGKMEQGISSRFSK